MKRTTFTGIVLGTGISAGFLFLWAGVVMQTMSWTEMIIMIGATVLCVIFALMSLALPKGRKIPPP